MTNNPDALATALESLKRQEKLLKKELTYFGRTRPEDEFRGRFANSIHGDHTIVGRKGIPGEYPAAAPAHMTQIPDEPPLGFSVEDQVVNGEPHEVDAAAEFMARREALANGGKNETSTPLGTRSIKASHDVVARFAPQPTKLRRRV